MAKVIKTTVYAFDELKSEKAKDKARQWYRAASCGDDWFAGTYEDAAQIGLKLNSFEIDSASFVYNLRGAFEGSAGETAEKIKAEHGECCETHKAALVYLDARAKAVSEEDQEKTDNLFLAALLQAYTRILQKELEYRDSAEFIDENIKANDYTFTADGKRFG